MKKNLGVVQAVYPMPVLMVAAYDENGKSVQCYYPVKDLTTLKWKFKALAIDWKQ